MSLIRNFNQPNRSRRSHQGFTLIEILAVVGVIAILTGLLIMATGYTQRQAGVQATRSLLCSLETALEGYKVDHGRYPYTLLERYSEDYSAEKSNSFLLYQALFTGSRTYGKISEKSLATDNVLGITYIRDAFQRPINYYCITSPTTPLVYTNAAANTNIFLATGGQINQLEFDLYSYGPDERTYLPGTTQNKNFNDNTSNKDDIWCAK